MYVHSPLTLTPTAPNLQNVPASAPSLTVPIPGEGRQRTISGSQRSPSSMPAPAIPRRAAPPRRKQAPPPPPPPEPEPEPAPVEPSTVELPASTSDTPGSEATETEDTTPAVAAVALPVEKDEDELTTILAEDDEATPPPASASPSPSPAAGAKVSSPHNTAIKVEPPTPHISVFANTQTTADEEEGVEVEDELDREELEDEYQESPEERRKRIAKKLKEMGAVNPFAGRLGEPAQIEAAAEESDVKMDIDGGKDEVSEPTQEEEKPQETGSTDHHYRYAHEHRDEDGSEVDYPGGSVASPTSPTRTALMPPVPMSPPPPPPPPRPPVETEKRYQVQDHYKASGEFAGEEGKVSSAADVNGGESKEDVQVLSASRQWAGDGDGDKGEGKHLSPCFLLDG
jgi:hypothetical protein